MAGLVLNGIVPFFSYLTGGFVHVGTKGWSVKCWSGAHSGICPCWGFDVFFQGGGTSAPVGAWKPPKINRFHRSRVGLSPHGHPLNTPLVLVQYRYKVTLVEPVMCRVATVLLGDTDQSLPVDLRMLRSFRCLRPLKMVSKVPSKCAIRIFIPRQHGF